MLVLISAGQSECDFGAPNEDEDKALTVTYALNKWYNLNSRLPSFRFGTGHIFNN